MGCWYTMNETYGFTPDADATPVTYDETGREYVVGTYKGEAASFETTYVFVATYADSSLEQELAGQCWHPLVYGTGTGALEGATGWVHIIDNVQDGSLDFTGEIIEAL